MWYRNCPKCPLKVSILGLGTASIQGSEKDIAKTVGFAVHKGINLIDLATKNTNTFKGVGLALAGIRKDVFIQVHFGADYTGGQYGCTTNFNIIKKNIENELIDLRTDYIDFGYIHCVDTDEKLNTYIRNGLFDYIEALKREKTIHRIGLSSHNPKIVNKVLDMGILDSVMFSINPAYDYELGGFANGSPRERSQMYQRIQDEGVGLIVMKPFCGGRLLEKQYSPFFVEFNRVQCLQYALDKPGVLSVLAGCRTIEDVQTLLYYLDATKTEKDYSQLKSIGRIKEAGCVYCGHCQPCPLGLNISLINKYYDLSVYGDELAVDHYRMLEQNAQMCTHCGICSSRCPFGIDQSQRMTEIVSYFHKKGVLI